MTSKSILFIFILCSFVAINCVSSEEEIISLGEGPMIKNHFDQNKINDYDLEEIIEHGEFLFKVSFSAILKSAVFKPEREKSALFLLIIGLGRL